MPEPTVIDLEDLLEAAEDLVDDKDGHIELMFSVKQEEPLQVVACDQTLRRIADMLSHLSKTNQNLTLH